MRSTRSRAKREQEQDETEAEDIPQPTLLPSKKYDTKSDVSFKHNEQPVLPQQNSSSDLPSYVPESHDHVDDNRRSPSLPALPPRRGADKSQHNDRRDDLANGTQQLSQSIYKSIILRSKSTSIPEDVRDQEDEATTQHTLNEGDEGHIDITSSFVTNHAVPEELEDSEPVIFSPSQPQLHLTQFPESQRFKTPATAGKKRNWLGHTIESPAAPRNPLVQTEGAHQTPSRVMGLSQAFAGTQAASSPFSNGLPTVLRSDRPSPNIEIQGRMAFTSSSPLRLLPDDRKVGAEPATCYVPMVQSQAERERLTELEPGNDLHNDNFDDFENDSSATRRERRRRERDQMFRNQLRAVTSPLSPGMPSSTGVKRGTLSSPIRPPEPFLDDVRAPFAVEDETTTILDDKMFDDEVESELETEQEDDADINVRRSSQLMQSTEENKENHVRYVPDTVHRLQRAINGSISQVEASPCVRTRSKLTVSSGTHSSEQVRIANSQPSQSHQREYSSMPNRSTVTETADFVVPGSPIQSANPNHSSGKTMNVDVNVDGGADRTTVEDGIVFEEKDAYFNLINKPHDIITISSSGIHTVQETNSNVREGGTGTDHTMEVGDRATTIDTSAPKFDTAQTHQSSALVRVEFSQDSSQPVIKTPPGRRRMRMLDISANNSPIKSPSGFDAAGVLRLDPDRDVAIFLQSSPQDRITHSDKRQRTAGVSNRLKDTQQNLPHLQDPTMMGMPLPDTLTKDDEEEMDSGRDLSQAIVQPIRQKRLARPTMASEIATPAPPPRHSIWEPDPSPIAQSDMRNNKRFRAARAEEAEVPAPGEQVAPIDMSSLAPTHNLMCNDGVSMYITSTNIDKQLPTAVVTPTDEIIAPNMVFACFNGKIRAYYPALCLGLAGSDTMKYTIQWEGYEPDEVDSHGVKSLDLRIGDTVKVNLNHFPKVPHVIRGFKDKVTAGTNCITDIRGYSTLVVSPKQRKSLPPRITAEPQKDVPVGSIYLDSNMWQQMKTRDFEFQSVSQLERSGYATPMERVVIASTPSSRNRRHMTTISAVSVDIPSLAKGLFRNMAFAISYDDPTRKNTLVDLIQANGGCVLDDSFHDLLELGKIVVKPQFSRLGFTALLTERHSRKEKYLQALALGLPCLSGRWVEACVKQQMVVEWQTYLLPAGESLELDGATRSRILPPLDPFDVTFESILATRPNLLKDASVAIVSAQGKAETRWSRYIFLIQALGAGAVHKAIDFVTVKELIESDPSIRWVFVEDKDVEHARHSLFNINHPVKSGISRTSQRKSGNATPTDEQNSRCKVAGKETIVQSVITGKLHE